MLLRGFLRETKELVSKDDGLEKPYRFIDALLPIRELMELE